MDQTVHERAITRKRCNAACSATSLVTSYHWPKTQKCTVTVHFYKTPIQLCIFHPVSSDSTIWWRFSQTAQNSCTLGILVRFPVPLAWTHCSILYHSNDIWSTHLPGHLSICLPSPCIKWPTLLEIILLPRHLYCSQSLPRTLILLPFLPFPVLSGLLWALFLSSTSSPTRPSLVTLIS